MNRIRPLLLLLTVVAAPLTLAAQSRAQAEAIADTLAITSVAIRHVAALKPVTDHGTPKAICLSRGTPRPNIQGQVVAMMGYKDPGADLIQAIGKGTLPIVPGSHCFADLKQKGMISDSASKPSRTAVAIIVSPPRIGQNGLASLLVERAFDLQTAYGYVCLLDRKSKVWTIQSCTVTWNT